MEDIIFNFFRNANIRVLRLIFEPYLDDLNLEIDEDLLIETRSLEVIVTPKIRFFYSPHVTHLFNDSFKCRCLKP
ncbi:CLUMA_CG008916, isoform A [Clunio marinus]|uniref:CLUMA_CG008916, isoform A n=1 Tax=Clunio marinus TaxID=568069 RepID=A0A1J1I530_9DIPT|nr:CLUMA_CG008916, isoform A [Clunio marinus]